jgi:Fic family protein
MQRKLQGHYITATTVGEKVQAFVPAPLPPFPPLEWSDKLQEKFNRALLALGRLDSVSVLLPDTSLFLYMYVRKEAVLSSMIEGTQSSLSDLLLHELEHQPGVPLDDATEVSNYVAALNYGVDRINQGFPLSLRLLKEIHSVLMSGGRGRNCDPGQFRRTQNWIGGTQPGTATFVPPPPELLLECMGKLELFLHHTTPTLVKAALVHVQFETIHPFLDGNGRLGRLIITLILCSEKVLKEPLLYLSLYFKTHRRRYYELLDQVRLTGDWEQWLDFFADAVTATATQAVDTAQKLMKRSSVDGDRINKLKRISGSASLIHRAVLERPMATPKWIQEKTQLSQATVNSCLSKLQAMDILEEVTGQKRNRIYSYTEYIKIMSQGTELPSH